MDLQKIYNRLLMMTGEEENQELLLTLCSAAAADIRRKVRDGCDQQEERLNAAAAGLAYYMLALIKYGGEGTASFKAGDITVTRKGEAAIRLAEQVRDTYYQLAADLLEDTDFLFRKVTA